MTYLFFSLVLIVCSLFIDYVFGARLAFKLSTLKLMLLLIGLTYIFDNLIVGLDVVRYNPDNYLGLLLPYMPIEDFSYAIAAAILVPSLRARYVQKS